MPPLTRQTSSSPSRYDWVDFAKGFCIIAVVALWVNKSVGVGQTGWIGYFVTFAKPFRMPDFFLISGLFLSRVITRPWPHYLDTKVAHYLYFLVLWTLIIIPGMWMLKDDWPPTPSDALGELIQGFYRPPAMLWFLLALSTFFVIARLLQAIPKVVVTVIAVALMLISPRTGIPAADWFCTYFVFFYCGYAYSERFFLLADWAQAHPRQSWWIIVIWAMFNAIMIKLAGGENHAVLLLLGFLGISALVMLSSLLSKRPWFSWLSRLGKNSIAVYLGFYLLLQTFLWAAERLDVLDAHKPTMATLAWILCIAGSVVLFRATRHTPLKYLYARPAWAKLTSWTDSTPVSRVSRGESPHQ